MADVNFTSFASITPASTDQIVLIDDPAGTPNEGKAAVQAVVEASTAALVPVAFTADNRLVRTDTVSSDRSEQESAVTLDDSGNLSGIGNITLTGTVDGEDVAGHVAATAAHGATGAVVGTTNTQTLTNKTLTSPTVDGTGLSVNTAGGTDATIDEGGVDKTSAGSEVWDVTNGGAGSIQLRQAGVPVVTTTDTQTLTNKTLTSPTIAAFTNAAHNHENAGGGALLDAAAIGTGLLANARIATGTPDGTKFLRDDQVWTTPAGSGDVSGPGSSTDTAVALWNGVGGDTLQDSAVLIDVSSNVSGVGSITLTGTVDGRDVATDGSTLDTHVGAANPHSGSAASGANTDITSVSGVTLSGTTTLAGDLTRAADQTIDLTGAATRTLNVLNSTASQQCDLQVDGAIKYSNGTAFSVTLAGTPTADRTLTMAPDQNIDLTPASGSYASSAHTALSSAHGVSGEVVGTTDSQTLTNKTLTTPTIASFTNAGHSHQDAAGGGTLASAATPTAIHDDTAAEISALTEKVTPVSGDHLIIEDSAAANVKKRVLVGNLPTGGGGEANTGSNVGTDGVGVFDGKVGVDLQFRHIASTDTELLGVALDAGDNDVDLTIAGAPTVKVNALKGSPGTINAGEVVYVSGWNVGNSVIEVELADADNSSAMPAIGIADGSITDSVAGAVIVQGPVAENTTGESVGASVYVSTTPGAWTTTRPTGATDGIQRIGEVIQVGASGQVFVLGAGRTNDVPNSVSDALWTLRDDADATKLLAWQLSPITTGFTRTISAPDQNIDLEPDTGTYASAAKGVTNGDTHDHSGGDGAQINHTTLSNIGSNSHATIDSHIAATAAHGATGAVVGTTNTQTLTNKTLTTPTIASFTNATHNHQDAAGGGTLSITAATTGTLTETRGGTNQTTYAQGDTLYSDATNSLAKLAIGTAHQHFRVNSGATAPEWFDQEHSPSITIENPTSSEDLGFTFTNKAVTIQEMRAVLVGSATPSVTWTVRHGTDRNATGAEVVTGGTTTTSTTTGSDVTSFNDATIVADSFVWVETTAQSGTVTQIQITIIYTED